MPIINFILHIGEHLQQIVNDYGSWVYAVLFAIVFCETGLVILPFLPGDSMLFAAGSIAAMGGMNIFVLVGLLILAAVLGDFVNFEIGKHFGQKLFANPNSRIFKPQYLQKTQDYYAKYGGRTIIIARFVPIVRTFAPFVGGMGQMPYREFIKYNLVGAVLWVTSFTLLGYFFGGLQIVKNNFSLFLIGIIVVSVLPMVIEVWRAKTKK